MTEPVRGEFPPAGGRLADDSPEQRVPEWGPDPVAVPDLGPADTDILGVDPAELGDEDLLRELHSLHRTRLDTLRHAADSALANHLRRTADLETEYLTRFPGREVDPHRLRDGE
ncbi:DUF6158 family protein [Plantactinospora siamensis]|uniref:DUF6158 family protein n=1 Tax=Plantactinospora siamensis TaxID=555372 RepID=A0ABV6NXV8_9ACTN